MSKLGSPCLPSLEFTDWFRIHRMYCYREIAILLRKRMIALLRVKKASETDSDKLILWKDGSVPTGHPQIMSMGQSIAGDKKNKFPFVAMKKL